MVGSSGEGKVTAHMLSLIISVAGGLIVKTNIYLKVLGNSYFETF